MSTSYVIRHGHALGCATPYTVPSGDTATVMASLRFAAPSPSRKPRFVCTLHLASLPTSCSRCRRSQSPRAPPHPCSRSGAPVSWWSWRSCSYRMVMRSTPVGALLACCRARPSAVRLRVAAQLGVAGATGERAAGAEVAVLGIVSTFPPDGDWGGGEEDRERMRGDEDRERGWTEGEGGAMSPPLLLVLSVESGVTSLDEEACAAPPG